eukprot:Opistho-1_new@60744
MDAVPWKNTFGTKRMVVAASMRKDSSTDTSPMAENSPPAGLYSQPPFISSDAVTAKPTTSPSTSLTVRLERSKPVFSASCTSWAIVKDDEVSLTAGASFTGVTVTVIVSVAELNAVEPPVLAVDARLKAVPVVLSHARSCNVAVPKKFAFGTKRTNVAAGRRRDCAADTAPSDWNEPDDLNSHEPCAVSAATAAKPIVSPSTSVAVTADRSKPVFAPGATSSAIVSAPVVCKSTGESFKDVTTTTKFDWTELNGVAPPVVVVSATVPADLLSDPSHARNATDTLPWKSAVGVKRRRFVRLSRRADVAEADDSDWNVKPPSVEYSHDPPVPGTLTTAMPSVSPSTSVICPVKALDRTNVVAAASSAMVPSCTSEKESDGESFTAVTVTVIVSVAE